MKSIKCTFLLLLLLININEVKSQIRFGVKGGVDVIDHKINANLLSIQNRTGFQIGPTLELGLPLIGLAVDVAVMYGRTQYNVESNTYADASISNFEYITIPVNLKKRLSLLSVLGVYGHIGPYANVKIEGGDLNLVVEKYKSKSFEAGLNLGAGVTLFKNWDLGMSYRYNLTDNYSIDTPDLKDITKKHDKTWSVNLTYFF